MFMSFTVLSAREEAIAGKPIDAAYEYIETRSGLAGKSKWSLFLS
jgi:hypothetical protein